MSFVLRYFFNKQRITTVIRSFFTLQTQATAGVERTFDLRARKIGCGHELTKRQSFLSRSIPKFTIMEAMNILKKLLRVILGEFQKIPKLNRESFELCYTIEPAYNVHMDKRTENDESEYTKLFPLRNSSESKSTISSGTGGGVRGITTESSSDRDLKARTVHNKERTSTNAKLNANEEFKTDDFTQIIENTPDPNELFDLERTDEVKKNNYVRRHKLVSEPEKKETQTCKLVLKKTSGTIYETDYEKQMRNARRMLSEWSKP